MGKIAFVRNDHKLKPLVTTDSFIRRNFQRQHFSQRGFEETACWNEKRQKNDKWRSREKVLNPGWLCFLTETGNEESKWAHTLAYTHTHTVINAEMPITLTLNRNTWAATHSGCVTKHVQQKPTHWLITYINPGDVNSIQTSTHLNKSSSAAHYTAAAGTIIT